MQLISERCMILIRGLCYEAVSMSHFYRISRILFVARWEAGPQVHQVERTQIWGWMYIHNFMLHSSPQ